MSLAVAVLLGVLQGLTEFLPVSSSGHLALAQLLIPGFTQPGVVFDAMLHVGTAAAVVWYERREIQRWLTSPAGQRVLWHPSANQPVRPENVPCEWSSGGPFRS